MRDKTPFEAHHMNTILMAIGAKVVAATEISFNAKKLCEDSNDILLDLQTEIADLYKSFNTFLNEKNGTD